MVLCQCNRLQLQRNRQFTRQMANRLKTNPYPQYITASNAYSLSWGLHSQHNNDHILLTLTTVNTKHFGFVRVHSAILFGYKKGRVFVSRNAQILRWAKNNEKNSNLQTMKKNGLIEQQRKSNTRERTQNWHLFAIRFMQLTSLIIDRSQKIHRDGMEDGNKQSGYH